MPSSVQQANQLFYEAFKAYEANNLDSAQNLFEQGLELNPRDGQALYYLGKIYAQKSQWEQAAEMFRASVNTKPY